MLNVVFIYCYAECHYAECHYAECRSAFKIFKNSKGLKFELNFFQVSVVVELSAANVNLTLNIFDPVLLLFNIFNIQFEEQTL